MQETRYAIVVDGQGKAVFTPTNDGKSAIVFVLLDTVTMPLVDGNGVPVLNGSGTPKTEQRVVPQHYTLRTGERFIETDYQTALAMVKPRWTGQAWEETAPAEEVEATLPPIEDLRSAKLTELGKACEAAIYAGVTVTTQNGAEHFSLTINDQTNIANLAAQAQAGADVLYHADGELCRTFKPEEMLAVAAAAVAHKTRHTTLCNHYNVWTRRAQTRAELASITYGCPLPSDLAESMKTLMGWNDGNE